jgi:hypothetical protein
MRFILRTLAQPLERDPITAGRRAKPGSANLGPLARPGHRAVTHGGWHKHQPEPGYYLHRSPTGYIYLVTNQGILALGRRPFSAAIWEASKPKATADAA